MFVSNTRKNIFYVFLLAFLNAGNPVLADDFNLLQMTETKQNNYCVKVTT